MAETRAESVAPGPLLLAGGAEFDGRMAGADRMWLALLGVPRPRVGVIPTANEQRPELAAANGAAHFRTLDAFAEPLMVRDRAGANEGAHAEALGGLHAAYMAGGSPLYLAGALSGSVLWLELERRWRAGMGFGGSSAGAMVLCDRIFVRGRWAEGLGIVPGAVVLPHFNNRDAANITGLRAALAEQAVIGLGIDESTALVWHAGVWRAAGPGRVTVLAPDGVSVYTEGDQVAEPPQPR